MSDKHYETELYEPVKKYLEENGFTVRSEVLGADIAAVRDDFALIVELKKSFCLKLVYQAIERQKSCEKVYAAIIKPKNFGSAQSKDMLNLLKRLNIGLIFVTVGKLKSKVEVVLEPLEKGEGVRMLKARKTILLKEVSSRKDDFNMGGSTRKKLVTAYREASVELLCMLERLEKAKISILKKVGCSEKTASIFQNNFYNWFEPLGRGYYALSKEGKNILKQNEFKETIEFYRKEVVDKCLKYQEMIDAGVGVAKSTKRVTKEVMRKS